MAELDVSTARIATAVSVDGRYFQFAGTNHNSFEPGTLVVLRDADGPPQLGQVEDAHFSIGSAPGGAGRVLGALSEDLQHLDSRAAVPFWEATMRRATADTVESLYSGAEAALPIGTLLAADGVPARLFAHRFNRHTFWCGQSGSGKTYALGVVLEQILLRTNLPMVIFDPNADFVRIRESQSDADGSADLLRATSGCSDRLRRHSCACGSLIYRSAQRPPFFTCIPSTTAQSTENWFTSKRQWG
jgi:DNA helicase HerA-like ATPase